MRPQLPRSLAMSALKGPAPSAAPGRLSGALAHLATSLRAAAAGLCAVLAGLRFVLFAFRGAGLANFRAHCAALRGEPRVPAKQPHAQCADVRAVEAQAQAIAAFGRANTAIRADFASPETFQTSIKAGFLGVRHVDTPSSRNKRGPLPLRGGYDLDCTPCQA